MPNITAPHITSNGGQRLLSITGKIWFLVAAIGQMIFIAFILDFYGSRTLTGRFEAWNDKNLITGHVSGDTAGNAMFGIHVLLAAYVTLGGLIQLIPILRRHFPSVHRWNGRAFVVTAILMAIGGFWLTWVRGTHLSVISALSVSLNGVLILVFAPLAVRAAMKRRFDCHRRWALRLFIVVNGVWFFRVTIMAWIVINGGPLGMNKTMSGPADIALEFGSFLVPLAGLQIYLMAQDSSSRATKLAASALVLALTALMAVGIFGATAFMWLPEM